MRSHLCLLLTFVFITVCPSMEAKKKLTNPEALAAQQRAKQQQKELKHRMKELQKQRGIPSSNQHPHAN